MGKKLDQAIAEASEIEAAETDQTDRPTPPHVKVGRPNRARAQVLQIRLNDDESAAVERIAARRGLPASTVARERLLQMIAEEDAAASGDIAVQLVVAIDRVKELAQAVTRDTALPA